jgi:hypothetical protein
MAPAISQMVAGATAGKPDKWHCQVSPTVSSPPLSAEKFLPCCRSTN